MFSGIVEELGVVERVVRKPNLAVVTLRVKKVLPSTKQGSSISVEGVCLTVTKRTGDLLTFDVMLETLRKTTLGDLTKGDRVNLERALKVSDRISGHFVSGHVDDVTTVKKVVTRENYVELQISLNKELAKYVVPKGSVCLAGVSLTVGEVTKKYFSVYLIPFTLEVTTLGVRRDGDPINIETDILAKYVLPQSREMISTSPYQPKI